MLDFKIRVIIIYITRSQNFSQNIFEIKFIIDKNRFNQVFFNARIEFYNFRQEY